MGEITHISCIGAGLIGQGWVTQFRSNGYDLVLYDLNEAIIDNALGNIVGILAATWHHFCRRSLPSLPDAICL